MLIPRIIFYKLYNRINPTVSKVMQCYKQKNGASSLRFAKEQILKNPNFYLLAALYHIRYHCKKVAVRNIEWNVSNITTRFNKVGYCSSRDSHVWDDDNPHAVQVKPHQQQFTVNKLDRYCFRLFNWAVPSSTSAYC